RVECPQEPVRCLWNTCDRWVWSPKGVLVLLGVSTRCFLWSDYRQHTARSCCSSWLVHHFDAGWHDQYLGSARRSTGSDRCHLVAPPSCVNLPGRPACGIPCPPVGDHQAEQRPFGGKRRSLALLAIVWPAGLGWGRGR